MTRDNIRAMKLICILSSFSSLLFLVISYMNSGYSLRFYRIISAVNLLVNIVVYAVIHFNQKNITLSFHKFHAFMFLYIIWLTIFGMSASFVDSLNRGGFISFLITQVWAYDLIFIPPFVSLFFCGCGFAVFLTVISRFLYFPFAKYLECIIFYITIVFVNYFHYRTAVAKIGEQEKIMDDNIRLDILSNTDELTHVFNRNALRKNEALLVSDAMYVMMTDIDDFKHYNDQYGHMEGDRILSSFAKALSEQFGQDCVYRYGGDEFLILLPDFDEQKLKDKVVQISWMLNNLRIDHMESPTCSYGYAHGACHNEEDLIALIKEADHALYEAKKRGKNQISGDCE